MNKDINNIQKLYEANQEQSITVKDQNQVPKGYTGHITCADDGTQKWYKNGKVHREDGPAIIWADGTQVWFKNNKAHREDGPAIIEPDGSQSWFLEGKKYSKEEFDVIRNKYTSHIKLTDGTQKWYKNGVLHREDGPAIIEPNGHQVWYFNGRKYSREKYYHKLHKLGKISDADLFAELL